MALNMFANQISEALLSAARSTIPQSSDNRNSGSRVTSRPGLVRVCRPFEGKSMFWHNLWVERGRPRSGAVADVMRHTWASYHYTVCRVKLNKRNIENERFAECILSDIWSEVKHQRSTRSCPSSMVDDFTMSDQIAFLFVKQKSRIVHQRRFW